MVAKARRILDAPPRYLAQVKTDCLLTQRLPKRFTEQLRVLEALTRLKNQKLLWATRPSHAVTYASCQGLTLHNRVRVGLESCHLTLRHLYVSASRATSFELLEAA